MQVMLRRSLGLLEGMLRQRDSVLRKLKMGDFRKVFRFTRMILGQPRNWLLTGMSWVRAPLLLLQLQLRRHRFAACTTHLVDGRCGG